MRKVIFILVMIIFVSISSIKVCAANYADVSFSFSLKNGSCYTNYRYKGANEHSVLRISQGTPVVVKVYGRGIDGRRIDCSITPITIANPNENVYIYDLAYENGCDEICLGFFKQSSSNCTISGMWAIEK